MKKRKNVVFGMCVYDDTDGAIFTIESIILHHKIKNPYRITVANMNPLSPQGELLKKFCTINGLEKIVDYYEPENRGTSSKNFIFESAEEESIVICMDCHVLFPQGALQAAIDYIEKQTEPILVQGPLIDKLGNIQSTHWKKTWGGGMLGQWALDKEKLTTNEAFDIESQGTGCFAAQKEHWLGYNPMFKGFGGEEYYIHEKYRKNGYRAVCLPEFKWWHRFDRVKPPYPINYSDRIHNYIIGFTELELEHEILPMIEHLKSFLSMDTIMEGCVSAWDALDKTNTIINHKPNIEDYGTYQPKEKFDGNLAVIWITDKWDDSFLNINGVLADNLNEWIIAIGSRLETVGYKPVIYLNKNDLNYKTVWDDIANIFPVYSPNIRHHLIHQNIPYIENGEKELFSAGSIHVTNSVFMMKELLYHKKPSYHLHKGEHYDTGVIEKPTHITDIIKNPPKLRSRKVDNWLKNIR
jgi:hypothetical protein